MRNEIYKCIYKYIDLLYHKQRSLPHVSANCCVHRQGDVLWRIYCTERRKIYKYKTL